MGLVCEKEVFYCFEDSSVGRELAEKLSNTRPGSLIALTAEEMKLLRDPEKFHIMEYPVKRNEVVMYFTVETVLRIVQHQLREKQNEAN